jgi:hypothetical protein
MAEQRVERRLAAILAGDVAGYSRLMGADEEGTLARLNAHRREFLEPTIAEHRGRIVKRTGDGILIEFSSAVDATRCAIQQQRGMAQRNAGVAADERIELRIGIHVGDIMIEEGDIFGDGVMFIVFAARLSTPLQLTGVARVRTLATCVGCHRPPLGVGTPRRVSSSAAARTLSVATCAKALASSLARSSAAWG